MAEKTHWAKFNYRLSHAILALSPAMLKSGYEKVIDGKTVLFDSEYITWRIIRLLEPLKPMGKVVVLEQLAKAQKHIEELWPEHTQQGENSNPNTPE